MGCTDSSDLVLLAALDITILSLQSVKRVLESLVL